jgi:signal transduction histidine kinase
MLNFKKSLTPIRQDLVKSLDQIGGQYALSWPVAVISFFWASYISVAFDQKRFETSILGWLSVSLIAHIIVILVAIPIRLFLLPVRQRSAKPALTLGVFALFGLLRASIVGQTAVWFDLAPTAEWGYRQISALLTITAGLAVTTLLVANIAERQITLRNLTKERNKILSLQNQADQLLQTELDEIHEIINESIRPSLDEITNALSGKTGLNLETSRQTTNLITALINEKVRPISDDLHAPSAIKALDNYWSDFKAPLVKLTTRISVKSMISPILVFILLSATAISGSIYYAGFAALWIGTSIYLPFLLVSSLAKFLIPENWKLNIWAAIPITVFAHLGAAFPGLYAINFLDSIYPGVGRQFSVGVLGFAIAAAILALLQAIQAERVKFEADLAEANQEATRLMSNLNQRIWIMRKTAAQLLHGSVQASLTAANLRLRQGDISTQTLLKVQEDIFRAIASISETNQISIDLEDSIEELIDLWEGVCNIDIAISAQLVSSINLDPSATYCVNEFLKECVNNAIKHGQATDIEISITQLKPEAIEIVVVNNGQSSDPGPTGLGTRILDEITTTWHRSSINAGTQVWAEIPLTGRVG